MIATNTVLFTGPMLASAMVMIKVEMLASIAARLYIDARWILLMSTRLANTKHMHIMKSKGIG